MSYELNKTNGSLLSVIPDGLIDNFTSSLTFIGKNVFNYGEVQNENFLKLLENFSNSSSPANPLTGQLWFDSSSKSLKLNEGSQWKSIPTIHHGDTPVANGVAGDFWYNSTLNQLHLNTNAGYVLVGPTTEAVTATKFKDPVLINGVSFDGSKNIVISSTATFQLYPGSYISGEQYNGSGPTTWDIEVGDVETAQPNKIVARNSQGNIWFNVGYGQATASRYGDLAEKYLADQAYDVGTVISVGGEQEVTACNAGDVPIGVVSENPGYMMNSELENGTYIALKGRVKVKITGEVRKGLPLVAGPNGTATFGMHNYFAIALENNNNTGVIEAVIL